MSKVFLRFLSLIKTIGKTEVVDIDKNFLIAQNSQEHNLKSKQFERKNLKFSRKNM